MYIQTNNIYFYNTFDIPNTIDLFSIYVYKVRFNYIKINIYINLNYIFILQYNCNI